MHCFKEESCSYFSHSSKLLRFTWQGTCQAGKQIQNTFLNGPFLLCSVVIRHFLWVLSWLRRRLINLAVASVKSTGWKILNPFLASVVPKAWARRCAVLRVTVNITGGDKEEIGGSFRWIIYRRTSPTGSRIALDVTSSFLPFVLSQWDSARIPELRRKEIRICHFGLRIILRQRKLRINRYKKKPSWSFSEVATSGK